MINSSYRLLLFVVWVVAVYPASAANEQRIYKVELIVFLHQTTNTSEETWNEFPYWPDLRGAINFNAKKTPSGFSTLKGSTNTFNQIKSILNKSPRYEIITTMTWQQPGLNKQSSKTIHIVGGDDFTKVYPERLQSAPETTAKNQIETTSPIQLMELDGTVKVVLERYLHFYTDLVYREPAAHGKIIEENMDATERPDLVDYKLSQHRRLRSGELHYIDHPKFGMLVKITPVE